MSVRASTEDFTICTGADRDLLGVTEHGAQGVVSGVSSGTCRMSIERPGEEARAAVEAAVRKLG